MKIKLRGSGIRIVYRLIRIKEKMAIVVVGAREDMEVYRTAQDENSISRNGRKRISSFNDERRVGVGRGPLTN